MKKIMLSVGLFFCMMPIMLMAQTATPSPEPEITPEATPDIITLVLEPDEGQEIDPPITIELPDGWRSQNGTLVVQDILGVKVLPYTAYIGDVNGGRAFIVVLWGFENISFTQADTSADTIQVNPFNDASRLLRLALLEPECNVGVDVEREFPIGDKIGLGTGFAAVACPTTVDTRGWFVATYIDGLNFAFYVYAVPIETMDGAEEELQAILDTIRFDVPGFLERMQAEATPEATAEITAEVTTTP